MARHRRGASDTPVSFFSFQDVMMCMIGVTLITTLILILQLGRVAQAALAVGQSRIHDESQAQIMSLTAVKDALSKRIRKAEEARGVSTDARLSRKVGTLLELGEALEQAKASITNAREELIDIAGEAKADQRALLVLELIQQRDELLEKLEELNQRRMISYLVDKMEPIHPLVTEISSARIVMSLDRSRESPMSIVEDDPATAAESIIAIFQAYPQTSSLYLLLVVKPSGIPVLKELMRRVATDPALAGIQVGIDLIPEDHWTTNAFPAPLEQGGASP